MGRRDQLCIQTYFVKYKEELERVTGEEDHDNGDEDDGESVLLVLPGP